MKTIAITLLLFHLTLSACPDEDTLCSRCGGNHCLNCMASYVTPNGLCLQVELPNQKTQCLSYENSQGHCKTCNYGYYVNEAKGCSPIPNITRCLVYDLDTDSCIVCNGEMLPDKNGRCDDGDKCSIENCLVCMKLNGNEECLHCANNFSAIKREDGSYGCVFQNSHTLNCRVTHFGDLRNCLECDMNYYHSYGKCVKSDAVNIGINYAGKESVGVIVAGVSFVFGLLMVR